MDAARSEGESDTDEEEASSSPAASANPSPERTAKTQPPPTFAADHPGASPCEPEVADSPPSKQAADQVDDQVRAYVGAQSGWGRR